MTFNLPKWMVGGSPITKALNKALGTQDLSLSRQLTMDHYPEEEEDEETVKRTAVDSPAKPGDAPKGPRFRRAGRSLATMYAVPRASSYSSLASRWSGFP